MIGPGPQKFEIQLWILRIGLMRKNMARPAKRASSGYGNRTFFTDSKRYR